MYKYLRLLKIYRIAARYQLHELLDGLNAGRFAALLLKLPFMADPKAASLSRGAKLRYALEELGPIFIKFGQLLSTRRDMVPADIADELTYLQDQVAPFDGDTAKALIEAALGAKIETLFTDFNVEPLASASIAQVHTAKLLTGEEIVIKVIRPDIENVIAQDIALLHRVARLIENHLKHGKRLRAQEIVKDYEHIIFDELNLLAEAANGSQLKRNFEDSGTLYIPKVYWDYCRINVLVTERIYGIPVGRIDELKDANINLKKLAETGVEIFFTQVFNHSFFHADMHPGNIFVSRENPQNPQYIGLDCAIIGTLSKQDQHYLARNLLAIFQRDYRKVAELHVECGWVPANTSVGAFESAMRSVCEPIFEKPLKDISFGMLLLQLFRTASRFEMEVQPSLVLLQKTLLNVEGLGKQLYPELDLWQTALPFLERWQKQRLSPWSNLKKIQEKLPEWIEQAPEVPELLFDAITQAKHSKHDLQALLDQHEHRLEKEKHQQSRKQLKFALAALLAAALVSVPTIGNWLSHIPTPSLVLICAGLGFLYFRK